MGIDKLNAAARAAGFAMAVGDEYMSQPSTQRSVAETKTERTSSVSNATALVVRSAKSQANWATWGVSWSFWRTA
jgi:hypothetical protein